MGSGPRILNIILGFRHSKKALLFLGLLFYLSCDSKEFVLNNPLDPENPGYIPPTVTILSGPSEGETIHVPLVTFSWEGSENAILFRYKLDSLWGDWSNDKTVNFDYLDEGQHFFSVQSQYASGDTSAVQLVSFVVDAVSGPALMFFPRRHIAFVGETIQFNIVAEEVEDLAGAEFKIEFDPTMLEIGSISQGKFFDGDIQSIFHSNYDNQGGVMIVLTGFLGGVDPGVAVTGDLATVKFKVLGTGTTSLGFDGSEVLRGPDNNEITISEVISGLVTQ